MTTECIASKLEFQELEGRRVEAEFNGGQITSDSGGLLLREVESRYGFISGLAACFGDQRDPIPALSSPRWERSGGPPKSCTRSCIAREGRRRIRSRNSSWSCLPIGPRRTSSRAISCGCGSPRWPITCCTR